MERRRRNRVARRRETAGVYLNLICAVLIVMSLVVGRAKGIPLFRSSDSGEAAPAAETDAEESGETEETEEALPERPTPTSYSFILSFMGDVNFDDNWATMEHLAQLPGGITDAIDPDMMSMMNSADLFCVNNEFAFTSRGQALEGKAYTFRANPANVSLYDTMGVDLVTLANNHIYDFGPEGLTDTLSTLDNAGIAHVGAGETLSDASRPCYVDIQNVRLGFVNACNAEMNRFTPEATDSSSGVLLCYEHDKFLAQTREARANADYVIAVVHWGRDYVYETSDEQRALARELIDAGADVVIGGHSHSLQGIEYYNHCPIFYSLGSCWFNGKTLETYLLELHFSSDGSTSSITPLLVPAMQRNAELHAAADAEEAKQVTDLILNYSAGIWFESFPDEGHAGHTVALLHEDEAAVDDWNASGAAAGEGESEAAESAEGGTAQAADETSEGQETQEEAAP